MMLLKSFTMMLRCKGTRIYVAAVTLFALWNSCKEFVPVPESNPVLKLRNIERIRGVEGTDSLISIELWFEDVDGNVGLTDADTSEPFVFGGPYYYNLWIIQRQSVMGGLNPLLIPGTSDTVESGLRLPDLRSPYRDKYINGTFKVSLKAQPYPGLKPDSMVFAFELIDRSLKHSKRVVTPTIVLKHQ